MGIGSTAGVAVRRGGTLRWYVARLKVMSPREVAWRAGSPIAARRPRPRRRADADAWARPDWRAFVEELARSLPELPAEAARVAAGELELWGRPLFADPARLPWHEHPFAHAEWPRSWRRWPHDPKPVWELHRQQHLVALAGGAAVGGEPAWADTVLRQLLDWVDRNPAGRGPGWVSGYETAHRLATWMLALPPAAPAAAPGTLERLAASFTAQARFVESRPSRYSSANNHRLAELAGLLAFAVACEDGRAFAASWRELERETRRQTWPDGGTREQAAGYLLYVLEILWFAGLLATYRGTPLGGVRNRIGSIVDWLRAVADERGEPPPLGDDAEDRFVRVPYFGPRRAEAIVGRAVALLEGRPSLDPAAAPPPARSSVVLPGSGVAVLRGHVEGRAVRIVLDVGELGLPPLAAHGHADALSLLVDVDGRPLLRDSGTGAYAPAEDREEFRSTAAHNTVVVDGESQARPLGPHLWGTGYRVTVDAASLGERLDYVRASHDGYVRGPAGAVHVRAVAYLKPDLLLVLDRVTGYRPLSAALNWQLPAGDTLARLGGGLGALAVASAPAARLVADDGPFSPRYSHVGRAPRRCFIASGREVVFATAVTLGPDARTPEIRLARDGDAAEVVVEGPRPVRLVERWRGPAPRVER